LKYKKYLQKQQDIFRKNSADGIDIKKRPFTRARLAQAVFCGAQMQGA